MTLNVNLSEESFDGWQSAADHFGASVTAMVEIVGQRLGDAKTRALHVDEIGPAARELTQARRRRRPSD